MKGILRNPTLKALLSRIKGNLPHLVGYPLIITLAGIFGLKVTQTSDENLTRTIEPKVVEPEPEVHGHFTPPPIPELEAEEIHKQERKGLLHKIGRGGVR